MGIKLKSLFVNPTLLFLIIFITGTVLRILVARFEWINMDEGCYLNDARLVNSGLFPIKDFFSREPFFIISLSFFYKIFGETLFAGRLLSVFFSSVTILIIYKLGDCLVNKKVGLAAASFYALSPFVIDWSSIIKTEPMVSMLVSFSMLFFLYGIKSNRNFEFFVSGVFLGLSVLTRRNSIIALIIPLVVLIYLNRISLKNLLGKTLPVFLGFLISSGLPILYLIFNSDFLWVWTILGVGELIHSNQQFIVRIGVIWSALSMLFYIIVPAIVFLILYIRGFSYLRKFSTIALSLIFGVLLIISVSGAYILTLGVYGYGIFYIPFETSIVLIILLALASSSALIIFVSSKVDNIVNVSSTLIVTWLGVYVAFYAFYPSFFCDYLNDFSPVMSLAAAAGLYYLSLYKMSFEKVRFKKIEQKIFPKITKKHLFIFLCCILVMAEVITAVWVIGEGNIYNRSNSKENGVMPYTFFERSWAPDFANCVATYISSNCKETDEVFTADTVFVSMAHRLVVYNISYPHNYLSGLKEPVTYDPFNMTYSVSEIINHMENTKTSLVIVGYRTTEFLKMHPEMNRYIELRYSIDKIFGEAEQIDAVKIYKRNSDINNTRIENVNLFTEVLNKSSVYGNWVFVNGIFSSEWGSETRATIIFNDYTIDSLIIQSIMSVSGEGGIILRYQNDSNYYLARIIRSSNMEGIQLIKIVQGIEFEIGSAHIPIEEDVYYNFSIRNIGGIFEIELNSTLIISESDDTFTTGQIGLSSNFGARFGEIIITTDYNQLVY